MADDEVGKISYDGMLFDPACLELANYFLADYQHLYVGSEFNLYLAAQIQEVIEFFIHQLEEIPNEEITD